ncbi:MAG: hypothetical protein HON42_01635 [Alphaproteobacteria bacterium]|nr:hypothetical protein [Alphaproteobacteria bacterium]MBT5828480.1 hypothetical protein [Alphaproteobacteria bacterium]
MQRRLTLILTLLLASCSYKQEVESRISSVEIEENIIIKYVISKDDVANNDFIDSKKIIKGFLINSHN